MKTTSHPVAGAGTPAKAFTFIELLVVLGTTAILAAMVVPALAKARQNAPAAQCQINQKQLALGWIMYCTDNKGLMPINGGEADEPVTPTRLQNPQWCPGRMDSGTGSQPTNSAYIQAGQIFSYVNNVRVYRCPSDLSTYSTVAQTAYPLGIVGDPRVRSLSMNGYMNLSPNYEVAPGFTVYRKDSMLVNPGAANLWLFLDENPFSINDAAIENNPSNSGNPPTGTTWTDCPASYHNGGAGISFCDGHVMIKKWQDPTVLTWTHPDHNGYPEAQPQGVVSDLDWLLARTTVHQ